MKATGKTFCITQQFKDLIENIIKERGITRLTAAKEIGIVPNMLSSTLNGDRKSLTADTWNKFIDWFIKHLPKYQVDNLKRIPKAKDYYRSYAHREVSQRPGLAHLCINQMFICGEKDYNLRYYREHETWLNQAEICPKCLTAWQKAEAIWNKNQ